MTDTVNATVTDPHAGFERARKVADAVLFEGYVLYPYRASATKNQFRWQWGVVAPRPADGSTGTDRWFTTTQCVLDRRSGPAVTALRVRLRSLQVLQRQVDKATAGGEFEPVESLEIDGKARITWDEATEHEIDVADIALDELLNGPQDHDVVLPGSTDVEELRTASGEKAGRLVRRRQEVRARVHLSAESVPGPYSLVKLSVRVENHTDPPPSPGSRDELVRRSLVGAHLLLAASGATFLSSADPPEFARSVTASCQNDGMWPVLVGDDTGTDVVLASPIILEDHPEIAPESPGDMFDAAEIDEILALRVMTLTEEEKAEARATDPRSAAIVDRCDTLPPEIMDRLHGAVRQLGPVRPDIVSAAPEGAEGPAVHTELAPWWTPEADTSVDPWTDTVQLNGRAVGQGAKVRLHPRAGADAQDLFLVGAIATVRAVLHDVEGQLHLAVSLDEDPAADLAHSEGRYRYFHPDEVEPLDEPGGGGSIDTPSILVAGIGNIFDGDDGFGPEVAHRLSSEALPAGVKLTDFGIRGVHLAYDLLDGYDTVILIDAIPGEDSPGTVSVLDVDPSTGDSSDMDAHRMDPQAVLGMVRDLGGEVGRLLVVGCVPESTAEGIGLSGPVAAAVDGAAQAVLHLINEALNAGKRATS